MNCITRPNCEFQTTLTLIQRLRYVGNHKRLESTSIKFDTFCYVYGKYPARKIKLNFQKNLTLALEYKRIAKIKIYEFQNTHTLIMRSGYVGNKI